MLFMCVLDLAQGIVDVDIGGEFQVDERLTLGADGLHLLEPVQPLELILQRHGDGGLMSLGATPR